MQKVNQFSVCNAPVNIPQSKILKLYREDFIIVIIIIIIIIVALMWNVGLALAGLSWDFNYKKTLSRDMLYKIM